MPLLTHLTAEIKFYETHKAEWLQAHRDKFVVVKENDLLGFFSTFYDAYCAGVERYDAGTDFLIRRILPKEPVFTVFGL